MKKKSLFYALLVFPVFLNAQNTVKLNLTNTLFGSPSITYEYKFKNKFSVSVEYAQTLYRLQNEFFIPQFNTTFKGYKITPEVRYYFGKKTVNPFCGVYYQYRELNQPTRYMYPEPFMLKTQAVGIMGGLRIVSKSNFFIEAHGGLGYFVVEEYKENGNKIPVGKSYDTNPVEVLYRIFTLHPRFGFSIGWQFSGQRKE